MGWGRWRTSIFLVWRNPVKVEDLRDNPAILCLFSIHVLIYARVMHATELPLSLVHCYDQTQCFQLGRHGQ